MSNRVVGKHKRNFKPGQLAWIGYSVWEDRVHLAQAWGGNSEYGHIVIKRGTAVTILRPAQISDYPPYMRANLLAEGISWARDKAEREWLVLTQSGLALVRDDDLRIRHPRKGKHCV